MFYLWFNELAWYYSGIYWSGIHRNQNTRELFRKTQDKIAFWDLDKWNME